jgi:hypothetical protein
LNWDLRVQVLLDLAEREFYRPYDGPDLRYLGLPFGQTGFPCLPVLYPVVVLPCQFQRGSQATMRVMVAGLILPSRLSREL